MSGPDPSKPSPFIHGALREKFENANFENDLADLATRFSAQSGGGLSPELSADLALEIVLNEIVEQACLATGATGAAVVLEREGEMVCRATSGPTAPELGSRLDTSSGLSGECFKTQQTQWCDDAMSDQRVDGAASQRLGVRSVVVMPLLRGAKLVGMIELFSSQPYAFGVRDERTLEVLADRTVTNLDHAARPLELQKATKLVTELQQQPTKDPKEKTAPIAVPREEERAESKRRNDERRSDIRTESPSIKLSSIEASSFEDEPKDQRESHTSDWMLGAAALACAILLGLAVGRHWGTRPHAVHANPRTNQSTTEKTPAENVDSTSASAPATKQNTDHVPPGGLLVLDNGKAVFQMPPKDGQSAGADRAVGMKRAASLEPEGVMELSPSAAEGSLLERVEPDYPEAAREQKIQGTVILEVHIAADGGVQDIRIVSGPDILAEAASDAVKQWKFKRRLVKGSPVEMQTRVTLNFRLPK